MTYSKTCLFIPLGTTNAPNELQKFFYQALRQQYPTDHQPLCEAIETRYQAIFPDVAFARRSANPMDRRLDFTAYFLATIQVLEKRGEDFEQIRHICLDIAHEYVRPKNALHAWLKRLPVKIIASPLGGLLTRFMEKKTSKLGHPDGFRVNMLTDPAKTFGLGYGIDVVECGICKLFQKHGAGKYAGILCEVDKLTSSLAGLELIRSGTIANGAKCCDFRWKVA
ncbi:MAG: L-2-amino-thiazoline-4-carboxylic acid hydrolase [Saprospiraceae bacterium]|nr:L-2-amino-thiazoline-4-carboxylic acid hydrolase [Saprospiraceae bacterium]